MAKAVRIGRGQLGQVLCVLGIVLPSCCRGQKTDSLFHNEPDFARISGFVVRFVFTYPSLRRETLSAL
jgi:hypothetical protein